MPGASQFPRRAGAAVLCFVLSSFTLSSAAESPGSFPGAQGLLGQRPPTRVVPVRGASRLTFFVPMRDGTRLATDVWFSPGASAMARPVLLRRTPYGRTFFSSEFAEIAASQGYTYVTQDTRGRGESSGRFLPFFTDAEDGADTIAWITAQPWSNGRVGGIGGSAEGIVHLLALGQGPPGLKCVHASLATDDFREAVYAGGAWRTELATYWLAFMNAPDVFAEWRAHEVDDAYWEPIRLDPSERARIRVPVFQVGGFFDLFASRAVKGHRALQTEADPAARADQFLVIGPWTHSSESETTVGEVTYPQNATYPGSDFDDTRAFFGWCLKGEPRPAWPAIRYYVTRLSEDGTRATGEWRSAGQWPPLSTETRLFLQPDGGLAAAVPAGGNARTLSVNPNAPIPALGGRNLFIPAGPYDQSAIDSRPDVLTATTSAVTQQTELIGDVRATIWASSATTDIDVIVRLSQVTPGGRAILLTDGIRRGRTVGGYDAIRPLTPGVPVAFEIEMGPIAVILPAGHALRISVSGTSDPRYEPNPGTATPLASFPTPQVTALTIYRDVSFPSAVFLPVTQGSLLATRPAESPAARASGKNLGLPARGTLDRRTELPR